LDVLETQRVEYVVGLASNARLDHRAVKRMTRLMLGFKSLWAARCTIAGIEGTIGRHGRGVSHARGTILRTGCLRDSNR
jgi:hypothetical protein